MDLSHIGGPFIDQASGFIVAALALGTTVGAFIAGRVTIRRTIVTNAQDEAKSWKGLYEAIKEKSDVNEARIAVLIAEGHAKDIQIASLTGKIDVILDFMQRALGPGFKSIIETTTINTKTTSG
jgi:hypothetical protein